MANFIEEPNGPVPAGSSSAAPAPVPGVAAPSSAPTGAIRAPAASAPPASPAVLEDAWEDAAPVPQEASEEDHALLESLLPADPAADRRVVTTLLRALLAENRGP